MIRVASYNVHGQVGRDGRADHERIARVLEEVDADVVGLQEVEAMPVAGGGDALQALAELTGSRAVAGSTLKRGDNAYGNAILSRLPVGEVSRYRLPSGRREPRGAVVAAVKTGGGSRLQVVTTHFGLSRYERGLQATTLLSSLGFLSVPTVLVGDFNEWWSMARCLRRLRRVFGPTPAQATYPTRRPLLALDRAWVYPAHLVSERWVHRSALAAVASDHLPVVVELELD